MVPVAAVHMNTPPAVAVPAAEKRPATWPLFEMANAWWLALRNTLGRHTTPTASVHVNADVPAPQVPPPARPTTTSESLMSKASLPPLLLNPGRICSPVCDRQMKGTCALPRYNPTIVPEALMPLAPALRSPPPMKTYPDAALHAAAPSGALPQFACPPRPTIVPVALTAKYGGK